MIIIATEKSTKTKFSGAICPGTSVGANDCYPDHGSTTVTQEACESRDCCYDSIRRFR